MTTPAAPTPGQGGTPGQAYQAIFNAAFYKSKPAAFQPLYNGAPFAPNTIKNPNINPLSAADRTALLSQLLQSGATLDREIDVIGLDPLSIMWDRNADGFTGVEPWAGPSATGTLQSETVTLTPIPAGWIKVSIFATDYTPDPSMVAPAVPAGAADEVGPLMFGPNLYAVKTLPAVPIARTVPTVPVAGESTTTDQRGTFVLFEQPSAFPIGMGSGVYFWVLLTAPAA